MVSDINNKTMALAARSVFAELYNKKKDIYLVVAEYVVRTLDLLDVSFAIDDVKDLLEGTYGLSIPQSVVKVAIDRIGKKKLYNVEIKKEGLYYSIVKRPQGFNDDIDKTNDYLQKNLLEPLLDYIAVHTKKQLSDDEKNNIEEEVCMYLLDKNIEGEYSNLINGFLVSKEKNDSFIKSVSFVREGAILEAGLKYTGMPSISQYCADELYIFLDTEVLFSAAGLNGSIFQNLFDSFLEQVEAINKAVRKSYKKKYISLFYTNLVEEEVSNYFKTAERSIENNRLEVFPKEAMKTILNKCRTASEVVSMQVDFWNIIKEKQIKLYPDNYNEERNKEYNIAYKENIEEVERDLAISDDDAYKHLCVISFINRLRNGYINKNIDLSRYIYVTGKNARLSVAKKFKEKDGCVAVTSLDWLTNIFWYRLNKGVLNEKFPLSFNAVTKAKILFAANNDDQIAKYYDDFIQKAHNVTEEQNSAYIYELKKSVKSVDEINFENINEIQDTFLSQETFEAYEERMKQVVLENQKRDEELEELRKYKEKEEKSKRIRGILLRIFIFAVALFLFFYLFRISLEYELWNYPAMQLLSVISVLYSLCSKSVRLFLKTMSEKVWHWFVRL